MARFKIVVGNEELTIDQSMAQMTIWSIWSAPLIMSSDLRLIRPVFKKILLNKDVIAIDQDPLGMFGRMILNETCLSIYVKPVTPYRSSVFSYAIALLNRCQTRAQMASFVFKEIGLRHEKGYRVKDLWTGEKSGIQKPNEHYRAKVRPTSARLIKATAVF
ncbi:hypothetical protein AB6A40_006411 [Gnathostoma spinigerum]|uniref:alpha-galactosidase n=1 Tax=Gnathostoma spinigerum TaxID=75299 RepID=A0ABD6ET42_9BILA